MTEPKQPGSSSLPSSSSPTPALDRETKRVSRMQGEGAEQSPTGDGEELAKAEKLLEVEQDTRIAKAKSGDSGAGETDTSANREG